MIAEVPHHLCTRPEPSVSLILGTLGRLLQHKIKVMYDYHFIKKHKSIVNLNQYLFVMAIMIIGVAAAMTLKIIDYKEVCKYIEQRPVSQSFGGYKVKMKSFLVRST